MDKKPNPQQPSKQNPAHKPTPSKNNQSPSKNQKKDQF